jgi:hypothetical protein
MDKGGNNPPSDQEADPRAAFYDRLLRECERAWQAGNLPALVDALENCAKANRGPPPWLVAAVATLVSRQMLVRSGRGRFNSRQARFDENMKHYIRWDMVRELRKRGHELYERLGDDCGLSLEKARARVAEQLKGTDVEGDEDAIKYSCELVERRFAEGGGAEFYLTRFKPDGKSG